MILSLILCLSFQACYSLVFWIRLLFIIFDAFYFPRIIYSAPLYSSCNLQLYRFSLTFLIYTTTGLLILHSRHMHLIIIFYCFIVGVLGYYLHYLLTLSFVYFVNGWILAFFRSFFLCCDTGMTLFQWRNRGKNLFSAKNPGETQELNR